MHRLTSVRIEEILSLIDSDKSAREICSITGIGLTTVTRYWSEHRPQVPKPSGGRPKKLTDANLCHTTRLIRSGEADNAVQVTRSLRAITNQSLSPQTTRNYLKQSGWKAVVKKKCPLLTKHHQNNWLDFATTHLHWTPADWAVVIWSDETKVNRLTSDRCEWVYKKAGDGLSDRLVKGTQKFGGGSLMIWGCMTWDGPGYATKIDGRMDAELYCQILEEELQESLAYYGKTVEDVIFQQDNDPKHTSKKAQTWFKDHGFEVLKWPAQSPDLNPIEHLWSHLKRKLAEYEEPPKGIQELWEWVEAEWEKIRVETCRGLIESMPRRVRAVYEAKGGYTKY